MEHLTDMMKYLVPMLENETTVVAQEHNTYVIDKKMVCRNLGEVESFIAPYDEIYRKMDLYINNSDDGLRIILISENLQLVRKTVAMMIAKKYNTDDYEEDILDDVIDDSGICFHILHLDTCVERQPVVLERFPGLRSPLDGSAEEESTECVLYEGISAVSREEKVAELLMTGNVRDQFVAVTPQQFSLPVVQRLIYDGGYKGFWLPGLESGHYESFAKRIMSSNGLPLAEGISMKEIINKLRKKRNEEFNEEDVVTLLERAVEHAAKAKRLELTADDFKDYVAAIDGTALDRINAYTGMENLKSIAQQHVAQQFESKLNKKLKPGRSNMIFYGNPGTGKTTAAKLFAELLTEDGMSGTFVVATRTDLIGEYVGQTAPKVEKAFKRAKGGVLFVDEAGMFVQTRTGDYADEALKEFVRYMEMEEYSDVTVIFALYPNELEKLLQRDVGLASRFHRTVFFPDYSNEELVRIADKMFEDKGYQLRDKARSHIEKLIDRWRMQRKETFGNAREMRKLADAAVSCVALRHYKAQITGPDYWVEDQDITDAVKTLNMQKEKIKFGFVGGNTDDNKSVCA